MIGRALLTGLVLGLGCQAQAPTIHLGYASYQGSVIPGNVEQFLGMRYAQPPVGHLRFRAPLPPAPVKDLQTATQYGNACLQIGSSGNSTTPQSEDCLYVNLWRPAGMKPSDRLPIMVWLYGGAFTNGESSYNVYTGDKLVKISGGNVIVVSFNYRLNAFGFLASKQVKEEGDLNVGLLDQQAAFMWVRRYASRFGGDALRVTAFGESAGAISIGYHMLAHGGKQRLFDQAMLFSGTALLGHCEPYTAYQSTYDAIVSGTGCATSSDTLACLRNVDPQALLQVAEAVYNPAASNYFPVIDGTYISQVCSRALLQHRFSQIPIILGTNTDEGTYVVLYDSFNDTEQLVQGLKAVVPGLTNSSVDTILQLYPEQSNPPGAPYPEFSRAASIIGDALFTCPAYLVARDYQDVAPVWKYRFDVTVPLLGAFHGYDVPFDLNQVALENFTDGLATLGHVMSSYYTSFAVTGNPNTRRWPGSPQWPRFTKYGCHQIVYQIDNITVESDTFLDQTCLFWGSIPEQLMH